MKTLNLKIKNDKITRIFNKHFPETVDKLNAFEFPSYKTKSTEEKNSSNYFFKEKLLCGFMKAHSTQRALF